MFTHLNTLGLILNPDDVETIKPYLFLVILNFHEYITLVSHFIVPVCNCIILLDLYLIIKNPFKPQEKRAKIYYIIVLVAILITTLDFYLTYDQIELLSLRAAFLNFRVNF